MTTSTRVADIESAGGECVGEIEAMDDHARYASLRDPEGNIIGVYASSA